MARSSGSRLVAPTIVAFAFAAPSYDSLIMAVRGQTDGHEPIYALARSHEFSAATPASIYGRRAVGCRQSQPTFRFSPYEY